MVRLVWARLARVVEEEAVFVLRAEDECFAGCCCLAGSAAVDGRAGAVGEDLEVGGDAGAVVCDLEWVGWLAM